jgi:hypothetical protein
MRSGDREAPLWHRSPVQAQASWEYRGLRVHMPPLSQGTKPFYHNSHQEPTVLGWKDRRAALVWFGWLVVYLFLFIFNLLPC